MRCHNINHADPSTMRYKAYASHRNIVSIAIERNMSTRHSFIRFHPFCNTATTHPPACLPVMTNIINRLSAASDNRTNEPNDTHINPTGRVRRALSVPACPGPPSRRSICRHRLSTTQPPTGAWLPWEMAVGAGASAQSVRPNAPRHPCVIYLSRQPPTVAGSSVT